MSPDETSPLLQDARRLLQQVISDDASPPIPTIPEEAGTTQRFGSKLLVSLIVDSIPVILSYILQNSVQTTAIVVTGRLGPDQLSAAAFSMMLAFVTGYSYLTGWCIALGGGSALDTLGSQAFTGGIHKTDLSIHLQRCVVLLWALFVPVAVLWFFIEPVLLAIGEPVSLCKDVQDIMRILIFAAPGFIAFESLKKYLQCQGIVRAATLVLIVVWPINLALNVALVHYTPLGMLGCPVALSITYWLAFFLLIIVTWLSPTHKANGTWGGLQPRAVLNTKSCRRFLGLALPGIFMVGTEWAAFEIVALAAGRLGDLALAGQSVIMTTDQIIATIPFGFGVVASNRVGNLIGAKAASGARTAAHACALVSVLVGFTIMVILLATKNAKFCTYAETMLQQFGYLYSDDENVVRIVSKVMPLVASFQIADGLANSCGGVLRGQGRQHLGAFFNIIAYYVLALPIGITLAFRQHLGLQGLWIGQVIGLFIVGISEYGVICFGTNWDKEVEKGIIRNAGEAKQRGTASE
ncbi:mate-domain-containing protein [Boletus edulis BED1]|uniref:Mate-domain-containing protein n=1 Tax=Boletus edulis BED1 TaxID=1328754 RepID=A0AAD4C5A9_BOLED|nr:mate-domain-containing protein [Boletus edulis BED1]